jgi:glycosyltransferase involved in cell wall biosynthesis
MPLVSVIIPTFNRAECLPFAIESVLSQSFTETEILVSDDGSTDNTAQVVAAINDPRVRFLPHEENTGAAAARNRGIQQSNAPFIALLDSDDVWLEGKLEAQHRFLNDHPSLGACTTDYEIQRLSSGKITTRQPIPAKDDWAWDLLFYCRLASGSSLLARKEVFGEFGLYDENLNRFEDWDWLLRLAFAGTLGNAGFVGSRIARTGHHSWDGLAEHHAKLQKRWRKQIESNYGAAGLRRFAAGANLQQAVSGLSEGNKIATVKYLGKAFTQQPGGVLHFCLARLSSF